MMLSAPKAAVASAEALLFTGGYVNDALQSQRPVWIYRDHQGKLQGPFSAPSMLQWYSTGRLPQDLLVCGVSPTTPQQAFELIPANCFRPLNQLVASTAQGIQYQPVAIAASQQAGMQMVQGVPQVQAVRPTMIANQQGAMQMQQVLAAQQVQGAMTLPAVRPPAPQLQQAFRPNLGPQQVVQLPSTGVQQVMQQQQAPNLVMMQQQQPQQVIITSQQQPASAMQPVMLMPQQPQQQVRPVVLPQTMGPRPQLQQQMVMPAARMAAPQQGPGGVLLQQVPQQPTMQLPVQQQGLVRPAGVAGVSMPGPAAAVRPGQPMLLQAQPQQQQTLLQAAGNKAQPVLQQPQLHTLGSTGPVVGRDAAAAHVAQRLEHLAAQAQARTGAGPVPPISLDKLGGPVSGPTSGNLTSLGLMGPNSARSGSLNNSFNNLDLLVKQANAAAAASGPTSAGAPAGVLASIRTDRRSSAGGGAEAVSAGLMGLHRTPREGTMLRTATPTGSVASPDASAAIDDMLFDLVEDVAVDAGEGPRSDKKPAAGQALPAGLKKPTPTAFLAGPKSATASAGASAANSPLVQHLAAGQGRALQPPGVLAAGPGTQQQGVNAVANKQVPGAQGGLAGNILQAINPQTQQQHQLLLMQAKQQQLGQQQQQQALLQQQQLLRQQQLAQQQQQQQAQKRQQLLAQQQVTGAQPAGPIVLTLEQAQQRQQQLMEQAMKQLQAGGDASDTMAALRQLMQQMQLAQQQQQQATQATATPASQAANASPAAAGAAAVAASTEQPGANKATAASPAASSQPAASTAPAAESGTKEFNPWGLSFMDPAIMSDVSKTAESKAPTASTAAATAGEQQGQAGGKGEISEDELLAALMPELNSTGLSADQKLGLLKQMLGMQQQQHKKEGTAAAKAELAAAPAQQGVSVPPPPQQQQQQQPHKQPTALQQLFQQVSQIQPAEKSAAAQKPQHVWLQQLANSSKAGGDAAGATKDDASTHGSKAGGKEGPGSEGGDEFDPSMLPADLFDFLDGHSSPTHKGEQTGNGRAEGGSWWNSTQQEEQQEDTEAEISLRPKYVPPGRRPSGEWAASNALPRTSSSTGSGAVPPPPPPPPSWTAREGRGEARPGSYVPPHARAGERSISPPPGYGRNSSSSGGGYPPYSDREREQRIQAQQQMLPPHLRIVPSEGGEERDRYEAGTHWPPPPPPPGSSTGGNWDEGPTRRPAGYTQREGPAGEEDGKGKLRRLFEAATANAGGAVPRQPPPPPPGAPRYSPAQSSWDRESQQPQRVPPGFESEFPEGPVASRVQGRDWEREQTAESYSRGYSRTPDEHGEYRRPAWAAGRAEGARGYAASAGYEYDNEWEGGEGRRGRGPAGSDRWQGEEDWDRGVDRARGSQYGERQQAPYPAKGREGDYDDRGRWYDSHDEHSQFPPPPRNAPWGSQLSPRAYNKPAPPAPPPRLAREPSARDSQWEDSDPYPKGPPTYSRGQPAPPPPREGCSGASSRQDRERGEGEPRSLTWQQEELLHEYDEDEPAGRAKGAGPARQQPVWQQRSGDYWDEDALVERERHRSPEPGARRTNIYGSPPSGSAPQPSQHLRAAAHTAGRRMPRDAAPSGKSAADMSARYQEDFPGLPNVSSGARSASSSKGYADALTGHHSEPNSKDASAAAMAAVAGLKPSVTTAPPRSSAAKPARKSPEGGFYAGPQLPSAEETKAAVLAALGSGPGSFSLAHASSGDSAAMHDAVQQHAQDSKHGSSGAADSAEGPAQLRKASGSSSVGGDAAPAHAAPRRNVVAATGLFSNVIGQLRRQSTARDSSDTQDGCEEAIGSGEGDDAPSSRGTYLSAASGRGRRGPAGGADAADIVLAVINSTRQRASKLSNRSRQGVHEHGSTGKADAAWQEAAPDTANSCDSSCGSAQQEAS